MRIRGGAARDGGRTSRERVEESELRSGKMVSIGPQISRMGLVELMAELGAEWGTEQSRRGSG